MRRSLAMSALVLVLIFVSSLFLAPSSDAQTGSGPFSEVGLKPFGAFQAGGIDQINLLNGSLNLNIPLVSFPQRGGALHLGFNVSYQNQVFWYHAPPPNVCNLPNCYSFTAPSTGVQVQPDFAFSVIEGVSSFGNFPAGVLGPDGVAHSVSANSNATSTLWNAFFNAYSNDGSGYQVFLSNSAQVATDRNGVSNIESGIGTNVFSGYEDPNGNRIKENYTFPNQFTLNNSLLISSWTDSLNRTINAPGSFALAITPFGKGGQVAGSNGVNSRYTGWVATSDFSKCTGTLPTSSAYLWNLPSIGGGTQTYEFCYAMVTLNISGMCGSDPHCAPNGPGDNGTWSSQRLQSILLPNQTSWTFLYDSANPSTPNSPAFGDLVKITFPTGAHFLTPGTL